MLVVLGVALALRATGAACDQAGFNGGAHDAGVGRGSLSPRSASAQLVQAVAQSSHASMQRTSTSRSPPVGIGCASSISRTVMGTMVRGTIQGGVSQRSQAPRAGALRRPRAGLRPD